LLLLHNSEVFLCGAGLDHDNYVVGSFGDSPEMATELARLLIARIKKATASFALRYFARQATREGFEVDDEILTVFERFEVVWPLDVADGINGPTSAST
jgi:uncharacterized protein YhfF